MAPIAVGAAVVQDGGSVAVDDDGGGKDGDDDDVGGDDAEAGEWDGDVGAKSVTGASWCKLEGGGWESESSTWTPEWRLGGAATRRRSHFEAVEGGELLRGRTVGWVIGEIGAEGWTIAETLGRMRNQPRNWPGSKAAGGDPLTPEAAPVDGGDAGACSAADDDAVGRPPSPGLHSTRSAIPVGSDSPSRGSAEGRTPDGDDGHGAEGPLPAAVRTG